MMLDRTLRTNLFFNSTKDNLFNRRPLGCGTGFELAIEMVGYIDGRSHGPSLPYLWQSQFKNLIPNCADES